MKVPVVLSEPGLIDVPDCYVELAPIRRKSTPEVSVVPPNSVDSEDLGMLDDVSEVRLIQLEVHVGYPEEPTSTETDVNSLPSVEWPIVSSIPENSETLAVDNAMLDVAAIEEVGGGPPNPELGVTEMVSEVNTDGVDGGRVEMPQNRVVSGSAAEMLAIKNKYDNRQRAIKEIAATQLLQEELAKSEPNLVSVFAFMNKVCGTGSEARKLKDAALSAIQKGAATGEGGMPVASLVDAVPIEERSVVAMETEKSDGDVNAQSVEEGARNVDSGEKSRPIAMVDGVRDDIAKPSDASVALPEEVVLEQDTTDVISLADTVVSLEGSSSDGDLSSSTCGNSVSATENRKRPAEGSPERGFGEGSRREFPGLITRSVAGCRVYIPAAEKDNGDCPGRILNDDGTFAMKITVRQDCEPTVDEVGVIATSIRDVNELCELRDVTNVKKTKVVSPSPSMPALSSSPVTSTPDPVLHSTIAPRAHLDVISKPNFLSRPGNVPETSDCGAIAAISSNLHASLC